MAFNGTLLKIGDYTISGKKYIKANSYSPYVIMQDSDAYTDGNGYLHRDAVELKALKVEFETPAMMTNVQLSEFMENLRRNFTNQTDRQCVITAYIPEYDQYFSQTGYMADVKPTVYTVKNGTIYYNPIRFAFIGGVHNG